MRQCVYCERKDTTSRDVSFHRFPKDEETLIIWLEYMYFDIKWRPRQTSVLCSKHFSSDCLLGRRLKKGSIPTIFENKSVINSTVVDVTYEKFKIKNEEVDIGDESEINGECKIKIEVDIENEEENESYEKEAEGSEIIGNCEIKLERDIESSEINESNEILNEKKEGDISDRKIEIEIKTEYISDEESFNDGEVELALPEKNDNNDMKSSDNQLSTVDHGKIKKPSYKYCIVPQCTNTIRRTPDKVFFPIPRDAKVRKQWCKIMRREIVSSKSSLYCCEDHFNVREDTANYVEYTMMTQLGEKCFLRLKKGIEPHIFFCQKRGTPPVKRKGAVKWEKLKLVNEAMKSLL